jgi:hypothetical protein
MKTVLLTSVAVHIQAVATDQIHAEVCCHQDHVYPHRFSGAHH